MKVAVAIAVAGALMFAAVALFVVVVAGGAATADADLELAAPAGCLTIGGTDALPDLDPAQTANARTIIDTGLRLSVPEKGLVVAIATAMQESTLRNLDYGDRDSLGLFQQRAAWGPAADRTDPGRSAAMFFTGGQAGQRGLLDVPGWQRMEVWRAAQAVQVSAFPTAYAKWTPLAAATVGAVLGGGVADACGELPAVEGPWGVPVVRGSYRLTARFGACSALWRRCHTGLDFAAGFGKPVAAAHAGRVAFVGAGGAYGRHLVKIDHGGGVQTWYAHMQSATVRAGQTVQVGEQIGQVGAEGNVTGPHLHLEVRVDGAPVDPDQWLTREGVSV